MKIEFTQTEKDLLTHQLLLASQSKRIKKRRAQGKIFLLLIYMATGLFIWDRNGVVTGAVFFIICLPTYFIYTAMEKRQYVKLFTRSIQDHFKDQLASTTVVNFEAEKIYLSDGASENIVPQSEVEAISEIEPLFSITLKTGQAFYIPKSAIPDGSQIPSFLGQLADRLGIPYHRELDWKWK